MGRATSRRWRAALWLIIAAASWGFGTVVAKRVVEEVAPLTLLAIQLGSSVLVLTLIMRWRGLPLRDPAAPPVLGRLGLLNPGAAYGLSLIGLTSISVSLSVLLWALEPLLILVLAAALLRERVGPAVVLLSGIAIAGLAAVAQPAMSATAGGVLLTVAGVVCCAVYTIVVRRSIAGADSTAQVVLAQQTYALGLAIVIALLVGLNWPAFGLANLTAVGLVGAVLSGVLYYAVAYWFYLAALRRVPASIASASFYLVPVFGVAGGLAFLGDSLSGTQWLGVAVAVIAVIAILRRTVEWPPVRLADALNAATAAPAPIPKGEPAADRQA